MCDLIPTKALLAKKNVEIKYESVVHEPYKSKRKKRVETNEKLEETNETSDGFNIKKVKHEIVKFGMSGFDPKKKEEAKIQLAVKLGAKPPKNKYKNYKLLQSEKKKEKLKEKSREKFRQLGKRLDGKSNAKGKSFDRKRKKIRRDILNDYGKVKVD